MSRFAWSSLIVGLVAAAIVVPWSRSVMRESEALLKSQQEMLAPAPAPAPVTPTVQAADVSAEVVRPEPEAEAIAPASEAVTQPVAESPAYSIVPSGSPELTPLEGWVDQPDKSRQGKLHTNLMIRQGTATAKPRVAARAPCLKKVYRPAERIVRPYGWVDVPARTVPMPCSE